MFKNKSEKTLLIFIIKAVVTTVISLLIFSYLISYLAYKLDLSIDSAGILSLITYLISAVLISVISVSGLKNSGVLMGILSQIPLIVFSLFNLIFNENTLIMFVIKVVLSVSVASLSGYLIIKKGKRYK